LGKRRVTTGKRSKGDKTLQKNVEKPPSLRGENNPDSPAQDKGNLVRKLEARQIELEQKNEELRRIQDKLKQESQEWKATFDSISELVSIHDKDFNIVNINKAFAEAFKTGPEHIIGKKCYELLHDSAQPWPNCPHRQALESGKPSIEEFWEPNLGLHLHISASPIFNDRNEVVGSVHIAKDITARKQAEEALVKYTAEIRDLYNNAPAGYHSLDKKGIVVRINDTELSWLGYSRDEIVGKKKFSALLTPKSAAAYKEIFPKFQKTGWLKDVEVRMMRKDGSILPVLVNASAVKDNDGNFLMSRCTVYDISERKRAQEALQKTHDELERRVKERTAELLRANEQLAEEIAAREESLKESEAQIRAFMDNMPSMVIIKDNASRPLFFNREFLKYFPGNEWLNKTPHETFSAEIADAMLEADLRALDEGFFSYEEKWTDKDGIERTLETRKFVIDRKDGPPHLGVIINDISDRKRAEEELRRAFDEIRQLKDQLLAENLYLQQEINLVDKHEDVIGNSGLIRNVLHQAEQVAATDSTVLIQGETGTGKELIAHAVHNLSTRKGGLLVKVNCAALPPTLIESELFGREKGAFTGALERQIGRFELADKSTIFLDEIDGLSLELQSKLLKVLQNGEFERLGSPKTVKVDVRVIAATNRDLGQAVRTGTFREDLYYRLNIFPITVPPLRDRKEDILPLVWFFVREFCKRMGKRIESIPQKSIEVLQAYPWPGNVRELRNVVERSMIITTGSVLHIETPKMVESMTDRISTLGEVERQHIIRVLNSTGWKISGRNGAAEILGMNPKTLESRMKKMGIKR